MDKLFFFPCKVMNVIGCWPEDTNWTIPRIIWTSFSLCNLFAAIFFELKYGWELMENPFEAFDAINPAITSGVTLFKLCIIVYYYKEFNDMHQKIRSYFRDDYQGSHYDMVRVAKVSAFRFSFIIFFSGFATNFFFFLRPIANNIAQYSIGGNFTRDLPFKASLPYDVTESPTYQITYGLLSYGGLVTILGFSGVDGLMISYCKYLSVQFDLISEDLRNDFNIAKDDGLLPFGGKEMELYGVKLRQAIRHHIELIQSCGQLAKLLGPIIVFHFLSAAIEIGLSLIDFIKLPGFSPIVYIFYVFVVLMQLLVYCIGGTDLVTSSENIHEAAYFTKWYRFPTEIRKDLLLMLVISTKGTALRVPFFAPSLPTFASILSASMSYVTILQSFF